MTDNILIFTDGASKGNPGPGGWAAIVKSAGFVQELGGSEGKTTNNRMELTAAIRALESVSETSGNVDLYTDSSYLIGGITKWVYSWEKRGWVTSNKEPVLNKDLWVALMELVRARGEVNWHHLPGHSGVPSNERADHIASSFAEGSVPELLASPVEDYPINLTAKLDQTYKKPKNKKKAYSYVSMLDGDIQTHSTWDECKKRVNGKKGARFKKAISKEDEEGIIGEWQSR